MSATAVNRVQRPTVAGKLTDRRSPHALLRSLTTTHLVSLTLLAALALAFAASSAHAADESCPNKAYRTGASAALPDCRAYELVSPPYKNGGRVFFRGVGSDEETVTFGSDSGFGGAESGEGLPAGEYVDERGAGGWLTSPVAPPTARFINLLLGNLNTPPAVGHSADRRTSVFLLHESSQATNQAGFYESRPGGSLVEVGPALPPGVGPVISTSYTAAAPVLVEGVSGDASHVLFRLNPRGTKDSAEEVVHGWSSLTEPEALLEYSGTCGGATECAARVPSPVGVEETEGHTAPVDGCASQILGGVLSTQAAGEEGPLKAVLGGGRWTHNAVSSVAQPGGPAAGNVVFLTDTCRFGIYARIDNGEADAHTIAISEPSKEACSTCETFENEPAKRSPAFFVGASRDGSKVFWTTKQPLLDGSSEEDLYEYDFDAPAGARVVRVSGGSGTVGLQGVVQVSEDGSHVYFVATGVLTAGANPQGQKAASGATNLYVFDSETGTTAFILSLLSNDSDLWGSGGGTPSGSDLTPDGRFLVFTSHADLTSGDTSTATQIFEYDAVTGDLVRVSIGEEGYNDDGNTQLGPRNPALDYLYEDPNDARLTEAVGTYAGAYSASAYTDHLVVSADGSYVFFNSSDGLTPHALNHVRIHSVKGFEEEGRFGPLYANNVYEYHAGNVYLISDGQDVSAAEYFSEVVLLGTDPSGRDVFFTTSDALVGQDTDTNADVYDARVDGGFPAPVGLPECDGDACQGALSGVPTLLSPGSEFQTGGNPPLAPAPAATPKPKAKPVKCRRGYVKRKGKCTKQKPKKKAKKAARSNGRVKR